MTFAPDNAAPGDAGGNIESVFRTARGLVAMLKDGRAITQIDGKLTIFDSLADYRDIYDDREEWPEITDPAAKSDFLTAAQTPAAANPATTTSAGGGDFRVGRVFERTLAVYLPNFLSFTFVTLIATTPLLLFSNPTDLDSVEPYVGLSPVVVGLAIFFLWLVLRLLSQAILVYGAFQNMRGKPVNLFESFNVAVREFFPLIGVSVLSVVGVMIGMILIIPGLIWYAAWFVAVPVCMVEQFGPWKCLERSAELTKGHRWPVFGIILLTNIGSSIVNKVIEVTFTAIGGGTLALIGFLIGNAIWEAFFAVFVVVTYYELRVAKEGIDIEQIASVFD